MRTMRLRGQGQARKSQDKSHNPPLHQFVTCFNKRVTIVSNGNRGVPRPALQARRRVPAPPLPEQVGRARQSLKSAPLSARADFFSAADPNGLGVLAAPTPVPGKQSLPAPFH